MPFRYSEAVDDLCPSRSGAVGTALKQRKTVI
jgi:hypothetical protein